MSIKIKQNNNKLNIVTTPSQNVQLNNEPICFLPIGTILQFDRNIDPNAIYGGKWEKFGEGRVLVGVGSYTDINNVTKNFDVGTNDSGEYQHTLNVNEMPSHNHTHSYYSAKMSGNTYSREYPQSGSGSLETSYSGGSQPHNNMQPYIVVYRWVRTA